MRLSWKHKFLYISIHKTASETVRELLDPYTQMTSCADLQTICYHHIPAKKMKYYFSERFNDGGVGWNWDEYFKFTTVRNPWDRKLSTFSYLKRKAEEFKKVDMGYDPTWFVEKVLQIDNECANFKQYLRKYCKPNKKRNRQVDWVLDREGNNMLDFVGKVENLEHDVKYAFKQIGLPEPNIVHKNKSNHRPYVDAYDEQWMIDKVAKRYADDIKHFNYEFGK